MATGGQFPKDDTVPKTDLIFATDFSTIRDSVFAIMGTGSGTSGYGASQAADLQATTVSQYDKVTALAWDTLAAAINRCRRHQAASPTLIATRPAQITAAWVNSVKTIADSAVSNKDSVASSELVAVTGLTSSVSTSTVWNELLYRSVRVTFPSQNAMRNFFNAGGYITVTHAAVTGNSGSKENNWKNAIDSLGECRYSRTQFNQSRAERRIGEAAVTNYSGSEVYITGHKSASTGAAYVDIKLYYDDGNVASGQPIEESAAQTGRIDETMSLNISSTVGYTKSAGQITSPTPDATSSWTDSGYSASITPEPPPPPPPVTPPPVAGPTYSITNPSPNVIAEGTSGVFTVNTTNVPNGTILYWTIDHLTTTAADFSATQGTITINSNTATITITASADGLSEGSESFILRLRTGGYSGDIVASGGSGTTVGDAITPFVQSGSQTVYGAASGRGTGSTFTYTQPSGVTSVLVFVMGGGGGGGGGAVFPSGVLSGGGGGGGQQIRATFALAPGQTISVDIGRGGLGGTAGSSSGSDGEDTVITASTGATINADGGKGGGIATSYLSIANGGTNTGGNGGTIGSGGGLYYNATFNGSAGANGALNAGNGLSVGGAGGSKGLGTGDSGTGAGAGGTSSGGQWDGQDGSTGGGGGGGAAYRDGSGNSTLGRGGDGGEGYVIIYPGNGLSYP